MSRAIDEYLGAVAAFVERLATRSRPDLEAAAQSCAEAVQANGTIWLFGTGHGQCLTLELHHRAGTSACFVPMASPVLAFSEGASMETALERMGELAPAIIANVDWRPGDVLFAISSSGTTPLTVEVARLAKEKGLVVVAMGSTACAATRPSKASIFEHARHVLDNAAPEGDAVVKIGSNLRVGAISSVSGAILLQTLAARVAELLVEKGFPVPVWRASALDGSDAHNDKLAAVWRDRNRFL